MPDQSIFDQINELQKKGLRSKKVVILRGPAVGGAPAVERTEESLIDDEGLKEYSIAELTYAPGCHHLIRGEEDLGGVCVTCGLALCKTCAANTCAACGRATCKQDQHKVEDVGMICTACNDQIRRRNLISTILSLGGVAIFVYLIMRLL
jgi:hypothetical protein